MHHAKCERALRQTRASCACSFPASTRHRSTRPPRPERRLGAAFAGSRLRPISSVRLPRSARSLLSFRRLTSHDRVGDISIVARAGRRARLLSPGAIIRLACPARSLPTASDGATARAGVIASRERDRRARRVGSRAGRECFAVTAIAPGPGSSGASTTSSAQRTVSPPTAGISGRVADAHPPSHVSAARGLGGPHRRRRRGGPRRTWGVRRFLAATGAIRTLGRRPAPSRTPRTARYLPGYDVSHRICPRTIVRETRSGRS